MSLSTSVKRHLLFTPLLFAFEFAHAQYAWTWDRLAIEATESAGEEARYQVVIRDTDHGLRLSPGQFLILSTLFGHRPFDVPSDNLALYFVEAKHPIEEIKRQVAVLNKHARAFLGFSLVLVTSRGYRLAAPSEWPQAPPPPAFAFDALNFGIRARGIFFHLAPREMRLLKYLELKGGAASFEDISRDWTGNELHPALLAQQIAQDVNYRTLRRAGTHVIVIDPVAGLHLEALPQPVLPRPARHRVQSVDLELSPSEEQIFQATDLSNPPGFGQLFINATTFLQIGLPLPRLVASLANINRAFRTGTKGRPLVIELEVEFPEQSNEYYIWNGEEFLIQSPGAVKGATGCARHLTAWRR